MSLPLISLASGVLPEFSPGETAAAAVAAGWPAVGIWVDPATWTSAIAADVRRRTSDAELVVLDVEVVWLKPGDDDPGHFRIVDAGAAIGARNVLVVSSDTPAATAAKLARLVDHAAPQGLRVCLEFAAFTSVGSLTAALDILAATERPDAGLLIDPLHFARTGGSVEALRAVDPRRLPYAQFCDAPAHGPPVTDVEAIIHEALDLRLDVGAGELPLAALRDALPPATPLSIELRSKAVRDAWPDPVERARAVLAGTRAGLAKLSR